MPAFLVSYMLDKSRRLLEELLDEFVAKFQTTYEHNWELFVGK